jgi:glycosyltransferase involved in cell wall biosynthesis
VARSAEDLPGIQLWCVYRRAPLLEAVRSKVAGDPALRDRVRLVGPVDASEVEAWQRSADYLLSASRHEGSGYAAIEAMACGTPPVLSDIPSFRRITDDGRAGGLFPVADAVTGAAILVQLERGDRASLRRRVRERFEAELSFAAIGRRLVSVYDQVLAG